MAASCLSLAGYNPPLWTRRVLVRAQEGQWPLSKRWPFSLGSAFRLEPERVGIFPAPGRFTSTSGRSFRSVAGSPPRGGEVGRIGKRAGPRLKSVPVGSLGRGELLPDAPCSQRVEIGPGRGPDYSEVQLELLQQGDVTRRGMQRIPDRVDTGEDQPAGAYLIGALEQLVRCLPLAQRPEDMALA